MPAYDGTGPYGNGRPGRGLGPCGRLGYGCQEGRGGGFRGGFRFRNRWFRNDLYPNHPDDDRYLQKYDAENLKARKRELEKELKWVEEELHETQQEDK